MANRSRFGSFDCARNTPRYSIQLIRNPAELEMKILERLIAATLVAGFIATGAAPAAIAQERAKQLALSTASLRAQLRDEIARMTSLNPKEIEVHATHAVIRVVLVNIDYNKDRPSDREYLASTISALVRANAEKDPAYNPIVVLHVEFVKRGNWFSKIIDSVEFRRKPDGTFARIRRDKGRAVC